MSVRCFLFTSYGSEATASQWAIFLFVSFVLNTILRQRNLLNKFGRENFFKDLMSAMTTWENRPVNRMKLGLLVNRTVLFRSSDLILPICKHVQVLTCFPHPTHLDCFASFTQKKNNSQEEKKSGKKRLEILHKKKSPARELVVCWLLCNQPFVLSCQERWERLLCYHFRWWQVPSKTSVTDSLSFFTFTLSVAGKRRVFSRVIHSVQNIACRSKISMCHWQTDHIFYQPIRVDRQNKSVLQERHVLTTVHWNEPLVF